MKDFWNRRSGFTQAIIVCVALLLLASIIGAAVSPSSGSKAASGDKGASADVQASSPAPSDVVTDKLGGSFDRSCLICDTQLKPYVETSNVWCGWKDGKVLVHVTMRNDSVEHLTVDWHPSYTIEGGGNHGTGLTSVESNGFDSGETRDLVSEQDPDGVQDDSPIATCKPSFSTIESG